MNFDHLRELNDLFGDRLDALILIYLARGVTNAAGRPLRCPQLARFIIKHGGSYVPEGNISRSLFRLQNARLVAVQDPDTTHPSYSPTRLGEQKAALLVFLVRAIEDQDNDLTGLNKRCS